MVEIGKWMAIIGAVLVVLGVLLWKTGGLGGLGQLPGDLVLRRGNATFYFPLVTCILLSILLSLVSWLLRR